MTHILVVEDDKSNLELMRYLLEAKGYTVTLACDGEEGYAAAMKCKPDLIISDIRMPKMDGFEFREKLNNNKELCCIPCIAVTASSMIGDSEKILACGFHGYIAKPIEPEIFIEQIAHYINSDSSTSSEKEEIKATPVQKPTVMDENNAVVLVVDDSPDNIELSRTLLEYAGYTVLTADRIDKALEIARQSSPDLILSDMHMADGSGIDFIRNIKSDRFLKNVPFIFISSSSWYAGHRDMALKLGAVRFLIGPIDPELFLQEIKSVLVKE